MGYVVPTGRGPGPPKPSERLVSGPYRRVVVARVGPAAIMAKRTPPGGWKPQETAVQAWLTGHKLFGRMGMWHQGLVVGLQGG